MTREAKNRIVDIMAAIVSGSRLKPGEMAIAYVRTLGGVPEAQVIGSDLLTLRRPTAWDGVGCDDTHSEFKLRGGPCVSTFGPGYSWGRLTV